MRSVVQAIAIVVSGVCVLPGQTFEVASVTPSNPVPGSNDRTAFTVHDRFTATGMILASLITLAYRVKGYQLEGGPAWIRSERYDIAAKSTGDMDKERSWDMLQTLLGTGRRRRSSGGVAS